MEQETRKFAIDQAIKLISSRQDITDKTKAVFDLADDIISWVSKEDIPKLNETDPLIKIQQVSRTMEWVDENRNVIRSLDV